MFNRYPKKAPAPARKTAGQAATELAVFGAILIYLIGMIIRTAVGNSYNQNQNFKAMRMAMLASWQGSTAALPNTVPNTAHNSASILFVEDRLSPDINKYGALERNPFIVSGAGTFTYELYYPMDKGEVQQNLPVMDVYINGQHFPFTMASYVQGRTLQPEICTAPAGSCEDNRCQRSNREWQGGFVGVAQFTERITGISPTPVTSETCLSYALPADRNGCQDNFNASAIFNKLSTLGILIPISNGTDPAIEASISALTSDNYNTQFGKFTAWFQDQFYGTDTLSSAQSTAMRAQLANIQNIINANKGRYKLFYQLVANPGPNGGTSFSTNAPVYCAPVGGDNAQYCLGGALSNNLTTVDKNGDIFTNTYGDMQYDLLRNGDYAAVHAQFPSLPRGTNCLSPSGPSYMRCNIAWQWSATRALYYGKDLDKGNDQAIGLVPDSNNFPTYDIDGRLKEVTIYAISLNPDGTPVVSYEDNQGGDIDATWDINSCTPKPGLQNNSQIYTFTQNGTYLQIKEGKLYDPETGQVVRSVDKRDNIDMIDRSIQLSNNTGRFCNPADASGKPLKTVNNDLVTPNPVEVCIPPGSGSTVNCFSSQQNIKSTCLDEKDNMLWIRSRLKDLRGGSWMTNASGQLKVH